MVGDSLCFLPRSIKSWHLPSPIRMINISKALIIGGWMSDSELQWLANRASEYKTIVEFGSLNGRSTRALADNTEGTIWAVDTWKFDSTSHVFFLKNLSDHIKTGRVIPYRGYSFDFSLPFKVDMVFIDAAHDYDSVIRDIWNARKLLKSGGLICGHDYHKSWPEVKKAVDELVGETQHEGAIWWKIE